MGRRLWTLLTAMEYRYLATRSCSPGFAKFSRKLGRIVEARVEKGILKEKKIHAHIHADTHLGEERGRDENRWDLVLVGTV